MLLRSNSVFLVARRAQQILEEENPEVLAQAIEVLSYLKASNPDITTSEDFHPFTECATFADEIKGDYWWQSDWHFKDQPLLIEGGSLDDFNFTYATENIVDALTNFEMMLKQEGDYQSSVYYKQVAQSFPVLND